MIDLIGSVLGIFYARMYELIIGRNYLFQHLSNKHHIFHWYVLVFFRRNFKAYVREIGLNPWRYPSISDLRHCKLSTKQDLIRFFPIKRYSFFNIFSIRLSTSGSTGRPFSFRVFIIQWVQEQARVYASFRLAGYSLGKGLVVFRSYSPELGETDIKRVRWKNWTYFNSYNLSDEALLKYYSFLMEHRIRYVRTYPSTLEIFTVFLKRRGLELSLKMIHVSSENISENLIRECEDFFGCRIVNYYGQSEQAVLGVNLNRTDSINLLPYTNVYQRDDGTLAATNLLNWCTPLVNYHVADKLIGTSPNQYRIIGRTNVLFKHTDGYWVSTVNIYTLMQFYSRLEKWQIVQFISEGTLRLHYRGELNVDDKRSIQEGLEMRYGTWRVAFFDGDFIYSGQGKINPILCLKE